MQTKKIQFIPGAVDAMREYAAKQYDNLLTNYDTFQIDDEYMDSIISKECVPQRIRIAVANDAGEAIWGLHPFIASERVTDSMLGEIIERLDAITKWCDDGNEFDYYCEFDATTGAVRYEGGNDDWYTDEDGNLIHESE